MVYVTVRMGLPLTHDNGNHRSNDRCLDSREVVRA